MRRRISMGDRGRLIALLALALIVRALVPTGWMPVATAQGVTLELCAGQSMSPTAAMHHGDHDGGKPAMPDHPCAFAGLGMAADTAPPPVIRPLPLVPTSPLALPVSAVAIGHGLAAPPPPATGPPAFA